MSTPKNSNEKQDLDDKKKIAQAREATFLEFVHTVKRIFELKAQNNTSYSHASRIWNATDRAKELLKEVCMFFPTEENAAVTNFDTMVKKEAFRKTYLVWNDLINLDPHVRKVVMNLLYEKLASYTPPKWP